MRASRAIVALTAALATVAVSGPVASAGEFTINACQADRANFATTAFDDFATTRGMRWKRACNPQGPGLRGLLTGNVVRSGRVARGARSVLILNAPPGTAIVRYRWSGHAQRRDCRYALQIYAEGPGGAVPIKNVPANRRCPKPKRAQAAGWPRPRTYEVGGASRIVQRVICTGRRERRFCSTRGLNYIRTFTAQATVVDNSPPAVGIIADNPFTSGEWVRGQQTVAYDASDNAGVRQVQAMIDGVELDKESRPCNYAQRVPCASGPGHIRVGTGQVHREGTQQLNLVAEDAAGNRAMASTTVRIDNTPPGAVPVGVDGGEGWRNSNAFDLGWSNPPEGDRAPIAAAHYRVCRAGTNDCQTDSRSAAGIAQVGGLAVPEAGEWDVRVWRGDAAGNAEPGNASVPVRLRFDPEPPVPAFEPQAASDPTRVSVMVTDRVSGLAGGTVEISRQGSGVWQTLDTGQEGSRLVARVDDSALPAGTYVLRATAHDQAGNQAGTDRRIDGQLMVVELPLRVQTRMDAGKAATKRVRRTVGRGGKRRKVWRRVQVLRPKVTVRFGRPVRLAGRLAHSDGQPLAGAPVYVYSRTPVSEPQLVATVQTDQRGRFSYRARATSTRLLQFVYAGSATILPANAAVEIRARARSTLKVSDRRVLNGRSVTFSGRALGGPLPAEGKLIEMQVRLSGGWETFRTPRADPDGRWRLRYRFARTCGTQHFRFRARLPKEAGYPYETGASPTVTVKVRGRPCS